MNKLTLIICTLFMMSCSNNETKKVSYSEEKVEPAVNKTEYSLKDFSVKWTAFKHLSKAQVGGKFDSVYVNGFKKSFDINESISGVTFRIPVNSTSTGDNVRDYKIVNSFFKTLKNTDFITGAITSINNNGSGKLKIKMNEIEMDKEFSWQMDQASRDFFLKTSIDVFNWNGQNALNALNDVCLEQHTGPDGVNKLWPNVDIIVYASL